MKEIFDKRCYNWTSDFEWNSLFLRSAEICLNDKLALRGYVTIFEVYEYLGLTLDLERLKDVKNLSDLWWTYDGNNKINFGIEPSENGDAIYLNFNINID